MTLACIYMVGEANGLMRISSGPLIKSLRESREGRAKVGTHLGTSNWGWGRLGINSWRPQQGSIEDVV